LKTKCLEMIEKIDHVTGTFYYSHKVRSNGHDVAILPFRRTESGIEILLRKELTPAWEPSGFKTNAITGGIESGKTPKLAAIIEVREEGGYDVRESDLIDLGTIFISKIEDTIYHLFAVDVTDLQQKELDPDSKLESMESCFWANEDLRYRIDDALVYVLMGRLNYGNHNE